MLDGQTEDREDLADGSGRANKQEVNVIDRLRKAAVALNPGMTQPAIEAALEETDRPAKNPAAGAGQP